MKFKFRDLEDEHEELIAVKKANENEALRGKIYYLERDRELHLRTIGELERRNKYLEEIQMELKNYMNNKTQYFENYEKMVSALGEGIRRVNSEFKSVKRSLINRDHECTFDFMHKPAR